MKKYIYQLLCSLFIGGTMVACTEDYMETDKGHDTLTLSVNQQELVLNEKNHSQEALALSWTTGTNYGSGNRISYTLELAKAGTDFANPYSVDLGTGTYQWTKKVEELNQFLHTQFGIRLCRESGVGSTYHSRRCRNGRSEADCDDCLYSDYLPAGYYHALPDW